jgi:hypothetical protein
MRFDLVHGDMQKVLCGVERPVRLATAGCGGAVGDEGGRVIVPVGRDGRAGERGGV